MVVELANAIYAAIGQRLTKQPYINNLKLEELAG